ncbi:hypothetical protein PR048_022131 [Dryococelus australis]|uniref:Uncharacterized protein n=1 Tax=Dryococelus australis TaxID=614101 RepID=A0ABQ9H076_9NEOP|nr:hypothetical protein PR048_022131 [Dryococelus australis]
MVRKLQPPKLTSVMHTHTDLRRWPCSTISELDRLRCLDAPTAGGGEVQTAKMVDILSWSPIVLGRHRSSIPRWPPGMRSSEFERSSDRFSHIWQASATMREIEQMHFLALAATMAAIGRKEIRSYGTLSGAVKYGNDTSSQRSYNCREYLCHNLFSGAALLHVWQVFTFEQRARCGLLTTKQLYARGAARGRQSRKSDDNEIGGWSLGLQLRIIVYIQNSITPLDCRRIKASLPGGEGGGRKFEVVPPRLITSAVVSCVVWTNRTMVSSNTDTDRTGVLAVVDMVNSAGVANAGSDVPGSNLGYALIRSRDGVEVKLLTSHLREPGTIHGRIAPGFLYAGIVPDDAAGWRVFSGISRFPRPCIPALLHNLKRLLQSSIRVMQAGQGVAEEGQGGAMLRDPGPRVGGEGVARLVRLYSHMYKNADINCTLVVCCPNERRQLDTVLQEVSNTGSPDFAVACVLEPQQVVHWLLLQFYTRQEVSRGSEASNESHTARSGVTQAATNKQRREARVFTGLWRRTYRSLNSRNFPIPNSIKFIRVCFSSPLPKTHLLRVLLLAEWFRPFPLSGEVCCDWLLTYHSNAVGLSLHLSSSPERCAVYGFWLWQGNSGTMDIWGLCITGALSRLSVWVLSDEVPPGWEPIHVVFVYDIFPRACEQRVGCLMVRIDHSGWIGVENRTNQFSPKED